MENSMKRRNIPSRLICLTLIAGSVLAACGIKGDLQTPPPLWGEDIRSEAQKAEAESAQAELEKRAAEKAARKAKSLDPS